MTLNARLVMTGLAVAHVLTAGIGFLWQELPAILFLAARWWLDRGVLFDRAWRHSVSGRYPGHTDPAAGDHTGGHRSILNTQKLNQREEAVEQNAETLKTLLAGAPQGASVFVSSEDAIVILLPGGAELYVNPTEGGETSAHAKALRDLGCGGLQGYGIAKPMPRWIWCAGIRAWQPSPGWGGAGLPVR